MPAAGQVLGRGVEERAVIGERDVVEEEPVLSASNERPAAVLALHAQEPTRGALDGARRRASSGPST